MSETPEPTEWELDYQPNNPHHCVRCGHSEKYGGPLVADDVYMFFTTRRLRKIHKVCPEQP